MEHQIPAAMTTFSISLHNQKWGAHLIKRHPVKHTPTQEKM